MDTQTEFEANDFILCTKCDNLLMVPANTKQVICSECENVMDFVNISEIHKFLSYKRAFKNLSRRIYKERADKNYIYNSKQVAAQAAQQAAQHQAAYEQQQAAAAAQHAAAAAAEQHAAAAAQHAAKEKAEADRLVKETQAAKHQAAKHQAAYEYATIRKEQEKQAQERKQIEEAALWMLMETRQAANTLLRVPIAVRLNNTSIRKKTYKKLI